VKGINRNIRRFIKWLGPQRAYMLFFLLALTGLVSLMLNAVGQQFTWVRVVQSLLVLVFLVGASVIIGTRFPPEDRRELFIALAPALLALALGLLNRPLLIPFTVAGVGWIAIAAIWIRGHVRQEYATAIKHMRNDEFDKGVKVISDLIKREPEKADHYRFRADLYRMGGKIKRSRADYEKVIELTPDSAVGYNGLAEVYLQDSEYSEALDYARKALELESNQWVMLYNLGMIEDRLSMAPDAIKHLVEALKMGIPDSRHRLLTHLWLARAYQREGKSAEASGEINLLKKEQTGLQEWETIFENEAAAVLRGQLEGDVNLAKQLVSGEAKPEALTSGDVGSKESKRA